MKDLEKQIEIALDYERIFVSERAIGTIKCDIGGRTFEFKPIVESLNIDEVSNKELASILAKEMIDNRRENGISHEKLSFFKLILSEICHGIFYEGKVEVDNHPDFDAWINEYQVV